MVLGPVTPMIIISDPEDVKFVLNHPQALHKGQQEIQFGSPIVGESLIIAHRK